MMASNLISRLLPPSARSIYQDLRAHDDASDDSDLEERAGLALDEENLRFRDDELHNADVFNGDDSRLTTASTAFLAGQHTNRQRAGDEQKLKSPKGHSRWEAQSPRLIEDDGDDDVPESLLIEGNPSPGPSNATQQRKHARQGAIPGPSTRESRARWESVQAQQRLHQDDGAGDRRNPKPLRQKSGILTGSPRDKAMWTWVNVTNLDDFMHQVYHYYLGAGIWCIVLEQALNLLTFIFVTVFITFLTQCIDYKSIPYSKHLSEVLVGQCTKKMSGLANVAIWLSVLYVFGRTYQLLIDLPRLMRMHDFYLHLLDIPDGDMQTISWQDVVARVMALRDSNPITANNVAPSVRKYIGSQSKERLDAHDIANRLMRKDNYLIALFNKDILDLTLPIPFLRGRQLYSKTLEWSLNYCVTDLVFNRMGQINQMVLKDSHRAELSRTLKNRFWFAGLMNVLFGPVAVIYLLIVYFFKYANEYQKNPAALGARQYTPLAEWKFREFNELDHLFKKRLHMSYTFANRYLDQFPKRKLVHLAGFVSFIAGAVIAVFAAVSLLDPDLFLTFELTSGRTVLFYITIAGSIWGIAHGMIPEENDVFEPELALNNVIAYTHYEPASWQGRLHSDEVKRDFAALYQMKIVIFLEEILGFIVTPILLWYSLPKSSDQIIDFFREFTIHVDGVGYVCSFAVFDFKKGPGKTGQQRADSKDLRDDYYSTKHGKMAASYYGFLDNYALNPKTGVPGHMTPAMRRQFHPPPAFPNPMSPTLPTDLQMSRMGRSDRRAGTWGSGGAGALSTGRTPRFPPTRTHGSSPMASILLDPHHQPSSSGFGTRTKRNSNSRSRYQSRAHIKEETHEDDDDAEPHTNPYESEVGLDQSKWELSPLKTVPKGAEDEEDSEGGGAGGGVLGIVKFIKAQTDGRPGLSI